MSSNLLFPDLTYRIRKVVFNVYNQLGPIFREATYEKAMIIGLLKEVFQVDDQKSFPMLFKSYKIGYYIVDLLVDNKIILELKAVPILLPVHRAQIISYLKVTDLKLGLLINFGSLKAEIESFPNYNLAQGKKISNKEIELKNDLHFPELTDKVLDALFEVHHVLSPGFRTYIYRRAVRLELGWRRIPFCNIQKIQAKYLNEVVDEREIKLLIIDKKIGLLIVTEDSITELLKHRMWSYLMHFKLELGLVVNFNNMPLEFQFIFRKRQE